METIENIFVTITSATLVDYMNYKYITLNVTNKNKTFNNQIPKWFISLVIKTFNLKLDSREGSN